MQTIAGKFVAIIAVLVWLEVLPVPAGAQTGPGDNAICSSASGCTTSPTPAFIDASVLGNNRTDLCAVLYNILTGTSTSYPAAGAVIDARGLPGTQGTSMVCASGTTPWFNGSNFAKVPSTILLPAGTITIPSTWVLPGGTKLIGEGTETPPIPVPTLLPGATIIQACTNSISGCNSTNFSGTMLQFGSSCPLLLNSLSSGRLKCAHRAAKHC